MKKNISNLLFNLLWCLPNACCFFMLLILFDLSNGISMIIAGAFLSYDLNNQAHHDRDEEKVKELEERIKKLEDENGR